MWIVSIFLCIGVISNGVTVADGVLPSTDEIISKHMVAEAMLTSHFIDAALLSGIAPESGHEPRRN